MKARTPSTRDVHSRVNRASMMDRGSDLAPAHAPPPPNAPVGRQYDAEKTLMRLKYLDTILASPGITAESIAEAKREKDNIYARVKD